MAAYLGDDERLHHGAHRHHQFRLYGGAGYASSSCVYCLSVGLGLGAVCWGVVCRDVEAGDVRWRVLQLDCGQTVEVYEQVGRGDSVAACRYGAPGSTVQTRMACAFI